MREAGGAGTRVLIKSLPMLCPPHRGWSWSHRPRSRATRRGRKAEAATITKGNRRGQGHYRGRDSVEPRPGQSGCSSPRCLILCAVVALMCLRARGGRSSTTRWSSASVSRTSTHSSAYCASLASPISSICPSLSSIALLWLGAGTLRRITLTLGVLVAAWAIGVGLAAIRATTAGVGGFSLLAKLVYVADEH